MFFVQNRKIFYSVIGMLAVLALGAVAVLGVRFGIEFTGGSIVEVTFEERPEKSVLEAELDTLDIGVYSLRSTGEEGYLLRTRELTDETRPVVNEVFEGVGGTIERANTVGPVIGEELRSKALVAILVVVLAIILYVAFAFRHVSKPVASWVYGVIAILVLVHDLLVPLGLFAILGTILGAEVDILFVMALLTILGYSVNDTIVIFDRVRENLKWNQDNNVAETFEETVGHSLSQSYARSINTSLTTLIVVISLLVLGGSATTYFALVLAAGVLAGTYSSIALAAPLLVTFADKFPQKEEEDDVN